MEMKPTAEILWKESSAKLGQFIRSRVEDPATAEDILQEVFLKLQGRLDELDDPAKAQGWLFLVARNAVIDHYRTRKKTTALTDSLPAEPPTVNAEMEELHAAFHRLIDQLPARYREALVLTEFEGLTQEQLAKRLGISVSGAKSRVQRARAQLKELLLDCCRQEFRHSPGAQPCPHGLLPPVVATRSPRKRE
jgi:RNA polymerase sigma-70 factor (ECF subfamily)